MILAVDPGLATCGWALVRPHTGRVVSLGVLTSSPAEGVDEWTDRARRISDQAGFLADLCKRHGVRTIAAEAISCGGPPSARFSMGTSLCLSWGVLVGIACSMRIDLDEVTPKQWQHAVCPDVVKIEYELVFAQLTRFVEGQAAQALWSIKPKLRNHALDAVGVGVFAAIKQATRVTHTMEANA